MGQSRARLPRFAGHAVERARLTVVPRRRTGAPRMPFILLVSLVLLGGVVGLLLFNTHMQQVSFAATRLEVRAATLHATEQSLRMELDQLRDPQRVATRAQRLGMVPMVNPAFLRLSDGTELGRPVAASPADQQRVQPLPPRKPEAFQGGVPATVAGAQPPEAAGDGVPSDVPGAAPDRTPDTTAGTPRD